MKGSLETRGYDHQSDTDPHVFIGNNSILLVYVDGCLNFSTKNSGISDRLIHSFTYAKENFEFMDEGDMSKYLFVDSKTQRLKHLVHTTTFDRQVC